MPIDYSKYPPNWRTEIRPAILERDGHRCKFCGVRNHAVGFRNESGLFVANAGNLHCDASGFGCRPNGECLTYAEAQDFCEQYNCCYRGKRRCDDEGYTWIVIVLTIAHLDHDITNNDPGNLAALCQRCHLRYDAEHHAKNARATRERKAGQADMLEVQP